MSLLCVGGRRRGSGTGSRCGLEPASGSVWMRLGSSGGDPRPRGWTSEGGPEKVIRVDTAGLSGGPGCRCWGRVDTAGRGGPCGRGQGFGAPSGNGLVWVVCVEQVISGFVWKELGSSNESCRVLGRSLVLWAGLRTRLGIRRSAGGAVSKPWACKIWVEGLDY